MYIPNSDCKFGGDLEQIKKNVLEYPMCYNSVRYTTINSDVAYYNFMVHCFNM